MLADLRVLDLTDHRGELGPWLLANLGADVVRVEPPEGSLGRQQPPFSSTGQSLQYQSYNRGKRSLLLDPASAEDRTKLRAMLATVDVLIDSGPPGNHAKYGLDRSALVEANPNLITVVITPTGLDGPRATDPCSELTIAALGGPVRLQGTPDRAPVQCSIPQVWRHAGAEAAVATMVALARRDKTGSGQFVDVSAQAAMTWTMLNAMEASEIQGENFERTGATLKLSMALLIRQETTDGFVIVVPRGLVAQSLLPLLQAAELVDERWEEEEWVTWDHRIIEDEPVGISMDEVLEALAAFCAQHTKAELLDIGIEVGVSFAPINNIDDLLKFEQLAIRDFWVEDSGRTPVDARVESPVAQVGSDKGSEEEPVSTDVADQGVPSGHKNGAPPGPRPGSFVTVDGERLPSPELLASIGQHTDELLDELERLSSDVPLGQGGPTIDRSGNDDRSGDLPLAGLKVADFSWIGVGPMTAKCLGDHGATVVRVESVNRLDGLRGQVPFKDGEFGLNRSQFFGTFNTSKLGLSLDLKTEGGASAAQSLVAWADVVIDSFTPGAMERLGLGADQIRSVNPNVITVTTSLLGSGGPYSSLAGYGYHAAAIAGMFDLVGWSDLAPDGPWLAYTDTIGPRFIIPSVLAAIRNREKTGKGCHIEAAQLEIAIQMLAPELANYVESGTLPQRRGNRNELAAPQGVYRCAGDDCWVAISVADDEMWRRFRSAIGEPDWTKGAVLDSHHGRQVNHDAVDIGIEAWTAELTESEVEQVCLAAGVAAAKVQRSSDLFLDPAYHHRDFYRWLGHSEMGDVPYAGHAYQIEGYRHGPRFAAPLLGEHTFEVLTEHLGLDTDAIAEIAATGGLE